MALPLLSYSPISKNHRVDGFEIAGEEQSSLKHHVLAASNENLDSVIATAYRQIFNEQQMLANNRQTFLESQLRVGAITVRDFVRGLLLSDNFRRRNFDCNNNYRFAEMCIQRVLGRAVYSEREKLAWSIVLATEGVQAFADALVNSEEYMQNFGDNTVPYQRRRILPQHSQGEVTFAHMARYDATYLAQLKSLGNDFSATRSVGLFGTSGLPPESLHKAGAAITIGGAVFFGLILLAVILSWFGWVQI